MQNLPVKYAQQGQQQRGPYLEVTCAYRTDHVWRIPFLPGKQKYSCPVCFGNTQVEVMDDGRIFVWGEETHGTAEIDRLRMVAMRFNAIPMMPMPNQPGSLEDLLNQLG